MAGSVQTLCFANWPASLLMVQGSDRVQFLQNMCTADVSKLQPGDCAEALFTNVKGHVLAHAVLYLRDEVIYVLTLEDDTNPLIEHLDRYIIREDVSLAPADWQPLLVVGSPTQPDGGEWACFPLTIEPAWVQLGPIDSAVDGELLDGDFGALDRIRVASGWPLKGIDFGDGTLPQELSRDKSAISFTKGCYLGQETVARIDALGHVNKQIVQVAGDQVVTGMELRNNDKIVGTVTTAAAVDDTQLGLAMVRRGSNAPDTSLETESGSVKVTPLLAASS